MKTDNEIIAEFMSLKSRRGSKAFLHKKVWDAGNNGWVISENLMYKTSWDWLMPVVKNINKLFDDGELMGFDYDIYRSMQDWILTVKIDNAFADAISIIKWHNSNRG